MFKTNAAVKSHEAPPVLEPFSVTVFTASYMLFRKLCSRGIKLTPTFLTGLYMKDDLGLVPDIHVQSYLQPQHC